MDTSLSSVYNIQDSECQSYLIDNNPCLYIWTVINHENHNEKKRIHHTDRYQKKANKSDYISCPKTFNDIFRDPNQLDHFKKFLLSKCNGSEYFLMFILAINELKKRDITPDRAVNINRQIKDFLLGANGEAFMREKHPSWMEIVKRYSPPIQLLIEAQKLIYKDIKEKYYEQYLNQFPKEGDCSTKQKPNELVKMERKLALWTKFIKVIINFRNGLMNTNTFTDFKAFLTKEAKQFSANPMRIMGDKIVNTNKIVKDIEFWSEVERFKSMYDDKCSQELLYKKAKTIINCFLDSNVQPKIQVNVQSEISQTIIQQLDTESATRGLFHEAQLSVFMNLIIFWKRYRNAINAIDEQGYKKYQQLPLLSKHESNTIQIKQNDNKSKILRRKMLDSRHKIHNETTIYNKEHLPKISYSLETNLSSLQNLANGKYQYKQVKIEETRLPYIKKYN